MAADTWRPFGVADEEYDQAESRNGVRMVNLTLRGPGGKKDRAATWLRNAMIALGLLAAAAAVVSFAAQYRMVWAARHLAAVAALEAGMPDAAALVFASLGIALALHGKRAIRARVLNVGAVITSIGMNAIAAGPGWRDFAIWIMPPIAYALASDTAIGVVRAYTLARQRAFERTLADEEATPLAVVGGVLLWLLRLAVAPCSTLGGLRRWVVEECPVAPGRKAPTTGTAAFESHQPDTQDQAAAPASPARTAPRRQSGRTGTKTGRFLGLVEQRHGSLAELPISKVCRIASAIAPEVGLHPGSARSVLRARVLQAQEGSKS